jgi:hypothetical protein
MKKGTNSTHQIIKIGIVSASLFCVLVLAMALYAFYNVPRSTLMNPDMLLWRMGAGIIAYLSAAGLVFSTKDFFQNRLPAWISIPLLGSAIVALSFFSYIFISDYFSKINCEQKIRFSECYLLNSNQTILAAAAAVMTSLIITGAIYFIGNYTYQTFPKREFPK